MRELDLFMEITDSVSLIEAAAGTGKTFAIVSLYLRLLLERELPVESILVVTFTEAATEELRDRVRERLSAALDLFENRGCDDEFLQELMARLTDQAHARHLLSLALSSFDNAAIQTIHGFCGTLLQENAFECGTLFDTELLADQGPLMAEIADDLWRRHFYPADRLFIAHALRNGFSVGDVTRLIRQALSRYDLTLVPDLEPLLTEDAKEACLAAFRRASDVWQSAREEVRRLLIESPALNRNAYRTTSIPGWIDEMESFLAGGDPLDLPARLDKFTSAGLHAGAKKGIPSPSHPFFLACDELKATAEELTRRFEQNLIVLKGEMIRTARRELSIRKERRNFRSYDDLLVSLHAALRSEGGSILASRVRHRYHAALVDEFQDTDPLQYAIFSRLFAGTGAPLFLIGDPKQAIYSFRGADLFAYLDAARQVDSSHGYTLVRNWRSTPGLLEAVNSLFSGARPFLLPEIAYHPVRIGGEKQKQTLFPEEPPFVIWYCRQDGVPLAKSKAEQKVAVLVAREVARLVWAGQDGEAHIDGRPLGAGDIAILVRKNYQGRLVQKALLDICIPSVLHCTESLFEAPEALELFRILSAVLDPGDGRRLRGALATDIIGWSAGRLAAAREESEDWGLMLERFYSYHDSWSAGGFIAMATELLAGEEVRPRLLARVDGERRLTNLLHLVELLHKAEHDDELGMEGVVRWLAVRVAEPPENDDHQLRIETDDSSVQLVTVHRSKGLEYPVVFCPFAWEGVREDNLAVCHDQGRFLLDLGSVELNEHRQRARAEQFAEDLRLCYVALTRAKERCYLVWGGFRGAESSAPAYLFCRPNLSDGDDPVEATRNRMALLTEAALEERVRALELEANGSISVTILPQGPLPSASAHCESFEELAPLLFTGEIDRSWRITSFTGLVSGKHHAAEAPDRDAGSRLHPDSPVEEKTSPPGIINFRRGALPGTCLHAILEQVDFSCFDREKVLGIAREQLIRHGMESSWVDSVAWMVEQTLLVPLVQGHENIRLGRLKTGDWQSEMEFMLPLAPLENGGLARVLREHGRSTGFPSMIAALGFTPLKGMLRGFIDLVFRLDGRYYLIDWKSNFLGPHPDDYAATRLPEVMEREFYTLQYLIYAVAMHLHLGRRLKGYDYDRHFGGVFYIFLRGIDAGRGPGFGIFHDRPERALIETLTDLLTPENGGCHGE